MYLHVAAMANDDPSSDQPADPELSIPLPNSEPSSLELEQPELSTSNNSVSLAEAVKREIIAASSSNNSVSMAFREAVFPNPVFLQNFTSRDLVSFKLVSKA